MWQTLKQLGMQHRKKLLITFAIVALENILFLIYPLFGSFAVNAVMAGKPWQALSYAALVLLMWSVGALRRSVDTRTFARRVKLVFDLLGDILKERLVLG
jgi:uncharacterized membrane protein